ncbi:DUF2384 domain-containing protein [Rhodovibrio sodomensis]|uniref:DUF2384 domain-containing protein n=1 Tax=Rhodovibrio sodomensis TaxID=1088 RepID=A0ABS1D9Z1_9PROT|nr:antitoxin Xre-like helix-turn-helix domain-containing protein [Rhodovibrio sodomensis]MBK1666563.1 DUF2384 domain-containing protein [Rhodovibrio sodomensis]
MDAATEEQAGPHTQAVGLKAFKRLAEDWGLSVPQAAGLLDMSQSTWNRAKAPGYTGHLGQDQLLRLSALVGIYQSLEIYFSQDLARLWPTLPNSGPEFDGAHPVDAMIAGGLPKIMRVRAYLDALRHGA